LRKKNSPDFFFPQGHCVSEILPGRVWACHLRIYRIYRFQRARGYAVSIIRSASARVYIYIYIERETRTIGIGVGGTHANPLVTLVPARNQVTCIKLTYIPLSSVLSPLIKCVLTARLCQWKIRKRQRSLCLSSSSLESLSRNFVRICDISNRQSFPLLCVQLSFEN